MPNSNLCLLVRDRVEAHKLEMLTNNVTAAPTLSDHSLSRLVQMKTDTTATDGFSKVINNK